MRLCFCRRFCPSVHVFSTKISALSQLIQEKFTDVSRTQAKPQLYYKLVIGPRNAIFSPAEDPRSENFLGLCAWTSLGAAWDVVQSKEWIVSFKRLEHMGRGSGNLIRIVSCISSGGSFILNLIRGKKSLDWDSHKDQARTRVTTWVLPKPWVFWMIFCFCPSVSLFFTKSSAHSQLIQENFTDFSSPQAKSQLYHKLVLGPRNAISSPSEEPRSKNFPGLRPWPPLGGLTAPPQTPQLLLDSLRPLRGLRSYARYARFFKFPEICRCHSHIHEKI